MAVAGIDSHKDTLALAVVDEQGRELGRLEAENTRERHQRLVAWLGLLGASRVGIAGSGSGGRAAALRLQQAGPAVVEVPPQLTAQARRRQRTPANSDPIDAPMARSKTCGCWSTIGGSCAPNGTLWPTDCTRTWSRSARATRSGSDD